MKSRHVAAPGITTVARDGVVQCIAGRKIPILVLIPDNADSTGSVGAQIQTVFQRNGSLGGSS